MIDRKLLFTIIFLNSLYTIVFYWTTGLYECTMRILIVNLVMVFVMFLYESYVEYCDETDF